MSVIRDKVREDYARAVKVKMNTPKSSGSCGCSGNSSSCCGTEPTNIVTGDLYNASDIQGVPENAVIASFGCGNPTALLELYPGETVLDLGSGAGLDVIISARRVGPTGKAYGLDMTDEMLEVARENQRKSGLTNIEFLKGYIEAIPLPDDSVDVIISNCVINLSEDKGNVLKEAFRVLKPGGRFAVADIIWTRPVPDKLRKDIAAWVECIGGSLEEKEYRQKLAEAGFESVSIEYTRVYDIESAQGHFLLPGLSAEERKTLNGAIASGFVRARKPKSVFQMGTDYDIRTAVTSDLKPMIELLHSSGLPIEGVSENLSNFLVAVKDTQFYGVMGLEYGQSSVMFRSLTVAASFRKRGVAAQLVKQGLELSRQKGITQVYILTQSAVRFAEKWGWEKIERREIPADLLNQSALKAACPETSYMYGIEYPAIGTMHQYNDLGEKDIKVFHETND